MARPSFDALGVDLGVVFSAPEQGPRRLRRLECRPADDVLMRHVGLAALGFALLAGMCVLFSGMLRPQKRERASRSFDRYVFLPGHGAAVCIVLVALAALLMGWSDAGVGVSRLLFLLLACSLWTISIAAWLGQPWFALRQYRAYVLWPYAVMSLMVLDVSFRLISSSFAVDDELTSWNYWAEQHFFGVAADFSFTKAVYPQLFPAWIGSIYRAVGSFHQQWMARSSIALITLWLGLLMLEAAEGKGRRGAWAASVLLLLLWLSGFRISFERGLADPLMVVALLGSIHYFLRYASDPSRSGSLVFCVLLAMVAGYTKQPALLWACIGMPCLAARQVIRGAWPRWTLWPFLASAAVSAAWPLWFGRGFSHNEGVIVRSLGGRNVVEQIVHSTVLYLVDRPAIGLLLTASLVVCWPRRTLRSVWLWTLLPSMLAWFIWGAYSVRLGLHVLGMAALLILHSLDDTQEPAISPEYRWRAWAATAVLATLGASVGTGFVLKRKMAREHLDLAHGPEMTLQRYFGHDAKRIDAIYRSGVPIWVSSNYLNGMFYGSNPITAPRAPQHRFTREDLIDQLATSRARYAFSAGIVPYGPASDVLQEATRDCTGLFHEVTAHSNEFGFHVYQVDLAALRGATCAE